MASVSQVVSWVAQALAGDDRAFSSLVDAHLSAAYLTALAVVGRPSDAEDVAQMGFVRAFEQLHTCREPERFSGWLLRIVRNHALDWVRQRNRREPIRDGNDRLISLPGSPDPTLRLELLRALSTLSVAQREVVLLHDVEGLSHADISDALDISEVMSRQHLFVARQRLREQLCEPADEEANHGAQEGGTVGASA